MGRKKWADLPSVRRKTTILAIISMVMLFTYFVFLVFHYDVFTQEDDDAYFSGAPGNLVTISQNKVAIKRITYYQNPTIPFAEEYVVIIETGGALAGSKGFVNYDDTLYANKTFKITDVSRDYIVGLLGSTLAPIAKGEQKIPLFSNVFIIALISAFGVVPAFVFRPEREENKTANRGEPNA